MDVFAVNPAGRIRRFKLMGGRRSTQKPHQSHTPRRTLGGLPVDGQRPAERDQRRLRAARVRRAGAGASRRSYARQARHHERGRGRAARPGGDAHPSDQPKDVPMTAVKTLCERERELRDRLQTPGGPAELEDLADVYADAGAGPRYGTSVITYILVYERNRGIIRL